jgi:hypothetical protein
MKGHRVLVAAVVMTAALLLVVAGSSVASDNGHKCTVAKLDGLYVFTARGFTNTLDVARPVAIIELIRFNGDGTLDVPGGTVSINGNVFTAGGTGTYTVGDLIPPDGICVGTVTFLPIGIHFNSFIPSDDAKEFWMIRTDSGMCSRGR